MSSHECPAKGCTQRVSVDMLMCRPHWRMVPRAMQNAVWNAWQGGLGAGTAAHSAAIAAAVRAVNAKLASR
jgi:hypothetical protein